MTWDEHLKQDGALYVCVCVAHGDTHIITCACVRVCVLCMCGAWCVLACDVCMCDVCVCDV